MISYLEKLNRAEINGDCETERFFSVLEKNAHKVLHEDRALIWKTAPLPSQDPLLRWCVDTIAPWAQVGNPAEEELFHNIVFYALNILKPFVEGEDPISLDKKKQNAIYSCMEKQLCMMIGATLSRADVNSDFYQSIISLTKGV